MVVQVQVVAAAVVVSISVVRTGMGPAMLAVARAAMAMVEKTRACGMAAVGLEVVVWRRLRRGGLFESTASRKARAAERG